MVISMKSYANDAFGLTKRYKIRETQPGEEKKNRLAKLFLDESFLLTRKGLDRVRKEGYVPPSGGVWLIL